MQNIGTYFEIPVENLDRATQFYRSVFGFEFTVNEIHGNQMAFFPFKEGVKGITGALAQGEVYKPSLTGTLIYLASDDIDASVKKILESGGEVLFPKTEVPEYGWVAEFKDSEGNRVALFQGI